MIITLNFKLSSSSRVYLFGMLKECSEKNQKQSETQCGLINFCHFNLKRGFLKTFISYFYL